MSTSNPLGVLAEHAQSTHIAVIGGGIGGLVAAWECVKVGMRVTVFEASDHFGGVVRSAEIAGLTLDVGAESYATRGGHVAGLVDELGLTDAIAQPRAEGAWLAGLPTGAAPMPKGGVLGIPDNPFRDDVRRVIGWGGAWRAYLDRVRPPLTIGHDRSLGHLVRKRMGHKVLNRLVAPVTSGVYSARPDDIDVDLAAPGLNSALTRTGSLSGAVATLSGERKSAPGGAVAGLVGGMSQLAIALESRLRDLGVELVPECPIEKISVTKDGGWLVFPVGADNDVVAGDFANTSGGAGEANDVHADAVDGVADEHGTTFSAVIVATPEPEARRILSPTVTTLLATASADTPVVEIVTLVVRAPELDSHPRGTGVLTVPGSHTAKALTHSTAKWAWLDAQTDAGTHVVRVSFGAQGEAPATASMNDEDAATLAVAEASALLGVALSASQLVGTHRARYEQSQPGATRGRPEMVATAREAIAKHRGLGAVGAWLSGTGLAQVIPDAVSEADRVRGSVLWAGAYCGTEPLSE